MKQPLVQTTNDDTKVVLITGCAKGGIGYEYCKAFAARGCTVYATDIPDRMPDLADLTSDIIAGSGAVHALDLDVSSDVSVSTAVAHILSKHAKIDILVNNAGISSTGPLSELPLAAIQKTYEVNALGQLRMIQQVVPHMAARKSGCIVNVGSIVGKAPTPWAGSYCAAKAYVHAISHVLRVELRPFNVDVVLVRPGAVRSSFGINALNRLKDYEWKMYGEFKEAIEERARASQGGKSTAAGEFARHVAGKVLSRNPPRTVEYGHMTALFNFLSWAPLWVRDMFFARRFKVVLR
ncbi:short-chain dehydrogenase virD-like [Andrographis paniculata]|uniref:short-chain dehydrogenase virD-like n=1 Tax=Andrographis paniculata TaxID=175694 RepID=UPI0021E7BF2C|nr:short-chain dehydrogenase virD-like [Andrographis paniculata]